MSTMNTSKRRLTAAAALVFAVLIALLTPLQAYAEGTDYYQTADDYVAAGGEIDTYEKVADAMDLVFAAAAQLYRDGDATGAFKAVNQAYYGYYETTGFERNVMAYISGSRVSQVELQFSDVKKAAKKEKPVEEFEDVLTDLMMFVRVDGRKLTGSIDMDVSDTDDDKAEAETRLAAILAGEDPDEAAGTDTEDATSKSGSGSSGPVVSVKGGGSGGKATFLACFAIILREGLEAILVVGAIIAYLVKNGNKNKLKFVYLGCVLAIAASFFCAWLLSLLKLANSADQEIIEGVTALIAVLVLFYVSNWMISKAEADVWNKYIGDQVKTSAETGSVMTLGFTAFLAVFREGAEVILFYQPLLSEADNTKYVWGGFGVGCVVLVFIFLAIRFLSVQLPIRPFFLATSVLMFVMSISFLGSGIKELIEGDVIGYTSPEWLQNLIPINEVTNVLGLFPCYETLVPQLILIFVTVSIFVMQKWKRNNKTEAGILAILFGGLGVHKFYTGKYGKGLLYVAFCWSGIPEIVGVMQGVHYLTETQEEFEEELKPKPKKPKEKKQKQKPAKAKA